MSVSCVLYNTNTDDDRTRMDALKERLQKNFNQETQILDALVATALTDDRAAAHWLVNHADDPALAGGSLREYFLLLCPVNELANRFEDFWTLYRGARGWCPAMDSMPNLPLLQPFKATSCHLMDLYHAFNTVARFYAHRCPAGEFQLAMPHEMFDVTRTELAFQLCSQSAESVLAEAAAKFAEILAVSARAPPVPVRPPYRLTLCQEFMQAQHPQIVRDAVAQFGVDESAGGRVTGGASPADTVWQLRLYSRDVRLKNDLTGETHAVYRLNSECLVEDTVYAANSLAYSAGDRVAVVAPASPPRHGWALGLNCETGQLGHFNITGAQRVPCSSVWTLHKVANFGSTMPTSPLGNSASSNCWASFSRQSSVGTDQESLTAASTGNGSAHRAPGAPQSDTSGSSDSVQPPSPSPKPPQPPISKSKSFVSFYRFPFVDSTGRQQRQQRRRLQLHVMRHGERLDSAVGFNWYTKAFDQKGVFANQFDLNIPELLPTRPPDDFNYDAPLTLIGQFVSYHLGEALARSGVRYSFAYSSPALRCVQTAHFLLQGAGQGDIGIRIEPLLNEFLYDDCVQMPVFMTPAQLRQSGYSVDCDYKPHSSLVNFDRQNTPEKYQKRLSKVLMKIVDSTKKTGGPVLLVGHRTTLEFCPVLLMDRRSCARHPCIPYNAMLCLERCSDKKAAWSLVNCPVPGFTISEHGRFDGSSLLAPTL